MTKITRRGAIVLAASAVLLAGCGSNGTATPATSGSAGDQEFTIGISKYVSHPSLDASAEGFKKALADSGLKVTFDEQNAQADQATITSIANKFASADVDLVLAIATPSAQATAQVIRETPILFTAVTDPVAAGLVASNNAPGANVTGTTDMNPVAEQVELVKQIAPNAKTLGVIYSSGEVNSEVQVKIVREAAAKEGLEVVEKTVTNTSEVAQAAASLDVDAFYVPTDNNVVSGLEAVIQVAEDKKIPIVAGEADSVRKGAVITYGIDYEKLGYQTGEMAVRILKGEAKPESMAVESQSDLQMVINQKAAEAQGVTLSAELLAKANEVIK